MKNANSLRTQEYVARFGSAARHRVCQAALQLLALDAKLSAQGAKVMEARDLVNDIKQSRRKTVALINHFHKAQKGKETAEAAVVMQKIDKELLPKAEKGFEAERKLWIITAELREEAEAWFKREFAAADKKARRALTQVKKRWRADTARIKPGNRRELGLLALHKDKAIKGAWAKAGPVAGWMEVAFGADRPLSDETWQGRVTVREAREHLAATDGADAAGDKEAKEVRRALKNLGLRPAKDVVGRKWKPVVFIKRKPKRQRGRPREKVELQRVKDIDETATAIFVNRRFQRADEVKAQKDAQDVESARKDIAKVKAEIRKLTLARGGRIGRYEYD